MEEVVVDQGTIVVEDETLRHGFTMLPNAVLGRIDLNPGAKLTYMGLLSFAWEQGSCFPGQDRLAERVGLSPRSVWGALKQLQECGLISIKRRGMGLTNIYTIHKLG